MTPTLAGRIQSRLVLMVAVGVPWTLVIAPLMALATGTAYGEAVALGVRAVVIAALAGLLWEAAYHGLQQIRWEKDWPTLLGLVTGIPEGIVVFVLLDAGLAGETGVVPIDGYVIHFASTWLTVWAVANGPLVVVFPRWRFTGGRFW